MYVYGSIMIRRCIVSELMVTAIYGLAHALRIRKALVYPQVHYCQAFYITVVVFARFGLCYLLLIHVSFALPWIFLLAPD